MATKENFRSSSPDGHSVVFSPSQSKFLEGQSHGTKIPAPKPYQRTGSRIPAPGALTEMTASDSNARAPAQMAPPNKLLKHKTSNRRSSSFLLGTWKFSAANNLHTTQSKNLRPRGRLWQSVAVRSTMPILRDLQVSGPSMAASSRRSRKAFAGTPSAHPQIRNDMASPAHRRLQTMGTVWALAIALLRLQTMVGQRLRWECQGIHNVLVQAVLLAPWKAI